MLERGVQREEVTERADPGNVVHRHRLVVDGDAADRELDHPRDLVVHDQLAKVEGDARFDHPRPVDLVGACQRRKESGEGLLVTGLRVTELGVRLQPGDETGEQVAAGDLGAGGAEQRELRRAHAGCRELQVHGRGGGPVGDRAATLHQLRERDAGEHLGIVQHERAGEGDRGRSSGHGHAEDRVRAPGARRLDDHLGGVPGQLERADRADAEADERAAAELVLAAGDHRRHLDQLPAVVGARRLGPDRLAGVQDRSLPLVETGRLFRHVAGMHRRLVRVDVAEGVDEARRLAHVLEHRMPVLAGALVDDHDAFVEVGDGDAAGLEDDVHLRVATAQVALGRRRADRVLDEVRRDAHHPGLAIDDAATVAEDVECVVGLYPDAGALEDLQGAEMDVVELGFREHRQAEAPRPGPPGVQVPLHWGTSAGWRYDGRQDADAGPR